MLVIGLVFLGLVIGVAAVVWHVHGPIGIDESWDFLKAQHPLRWRGAGRLTWPGSPPVVAFAVACLTVACAVRRDWFALGLCAAGPATAAILVELVAKPLVDRTIGHALAYPSGHVTLSSALATLVVVLVYRWYGGRAATLVGAVMACVPLVVGVGVVRRGWHYPTDVVGAFGLGVGTVLLVAVVLSVLWPDLPDAADG
jgi:undecaprenyl-diphosphatase